MEKTEAKAIKAKAGEMKIIHSVSLHMPVFDSSFLFVDCGTRKLPQKISSRVRRLIPQYSMAENDPLNDGKRDLLSLSYIFHKLDKDPAKAVFIVSPENGLFASTALVLPDMLRKEYPHRSIIIGTDSPCIMEDRWNIAEEVCSDMDRLEIDIG